MVSEKSLQDIALDFVDSRSSSSFSILYKRLKPGLMNYIYKYHKDEDIVNDIFSITMAKSFIHIDKYNSKWNFSTWIYKICKNECLIELNRLKHNVSLNDLLQAGSFITNNFQSEEYDYEYFSEKEIIDPEDLFQDFLDEIKNLPEHYKNVLEDRLVKKMKYKDIAETRNININTVRTRIHSSKKIIRDTWLNKKRANNVKCIDILGVKILLEYSDRNVKIINAVYGTTDRRINVTNEVSDIFHKKNKVKSSNKIGGDPCRGARKKLIIEYIHNNRKYKQIVDEGKYFVIKTKKNEVCQRHK